MIACRVSSGRDLTTVRDRPIIALFWWNMIERFPYRTALILLVSTSLHFAVAVTPPRGPNFYFVIRVTVLL